VIKKRFRYLIAPQIRFWSGTNCAENCSRLRKEERLIRRGAQKKILMQDLPFAIEQLSQLFSVQRTIYCSGLSGRDEKGSPLSVEDCPLCRTDIDFGAGLIVRDLKGYPPPKPLSFHHNDHEMDDEPDAVVT
jgi:hypothetical protein